VPSKLRTWNSCRRWRSVSTGRRGVRVQLRRPVPGSSTGHHQVTPGPGWKTCCKGFETASRSGIIFRRVRRVGKAWGDYALGRDSRSTVGPRLACQWMKKWFSEAWPDAQCCTHTSGRASGSPLKPRHELKRLPNPCCRPLELLWLLCGLRPSGLEGGDSIGTHVAGNPQREQNFVRSHRIPSALYYLYPLHLQKWPPSALSISQTLPVLPKGYSISSLTALEPADLS